MDLHGKLDSYHGFLQRLVGEVEVERTSRIREPKNVAPELSTRPQSSLLTPTISKSG